MSISAARLERFTVPPNFDFGILSNGDEPICVVSVVRKASVCGDSVELEQEEREFTEWFFGELNKRVAGNVQASSRSARRANVNNIAGYYDSEHHVVFLICTLQSQVHAELGRQSESETERTTNVAFSDVYRSDQVLAIRSLLYLLSLSHIVLFYTPVPRIDTSWFTLLRYVEEVQLATKAALSEALRQLQISREWQSATRLCAPRVLFVFDACNYESESGRAQGVAKRFSSSEKCALERQFEDALYNLLRKTFLIQDNPNVALCAIPLGENEDFVFVRTFGCSRFASASCAAQRRTGASDSFAMRCASQRLAEQLGETCIPTSSAMSGATLPDTQISPREATASDREERSEKPGTRSLRAFLNWHVNRALRDGFNDVRGKGISEWFELPICRTWFKVLHKLHGALLEDNNEELRDSFVDAHRRVDSVGNLARAFCKNALKRADETYSAEDESGEGSAYTKEQHERRLAQALAEFTKLARGPQAMLDDFARRLETVCVRKWQANRRCEVRSITNRLCMHRAHRTGRGTEDETLLTDADDSDDEASSKREKPRRKRNAVPTMAHESDTRLLAACNCGRRQESRSDPFDVEEANVSFYDEVSETCCGRFPHVAFPDYVARGNANLVPSLLYDTLPDDCMPKKHAFAVYGAGPYGKYSHIDGLEWRGFVARHSFLVPWSIAAARTSLLDAESDDQQGALRAFANLGANSKASAAPRSSYKLYIGVEYECFTAGHRFICCAPNRLSTVPLKDAPLDLLTYDMPLYTLCHYCAASGGRPRGNKVAQLMRLYVNIPPGSNVPRILLNPRVRPAEDAPTFFALPGQRPIELSPGEIWVCRLPMAYADAEHVYRQPTEEQLAAAPFAAILKRGAFDVSYT